MSEKKSDSQEKTSCSGKKVRFHVDDFYAYAPENKFLFIPDQRLWPASSVDLRIDPIPINDASGKTIRATDWLSKNRSVEQMTWWPGEPKLIKDKLISNGAMVKKTGFNIFNLYLPPSIPEGDPLKAGPWISHIEQLYPEDVNHILA